MLWPEAESYERLMKLMINEGQASFQSVKQNDPYDPERQIFDMAGAKRFRLEYLPDGEFIGFRLADGSERLIPPGCLSRWVALSVSAFPPLTHY